MNGEGAGGDYDSGTRSCAPHQNHIPAPDGRAADVVGAGGMVLANQMYNTLRATARVRHLQSRPALARCSAIHRRSSTHRS